MTSLQVQDAPRRNVTPVTPATPWRNYSSETTTSMVDLGEPMEGEPGSPLLIADEKFAKGPHLFSRSGFLYRPQRVRNKISTVEAGGEIDWSAASTMVVFEGSSDLGGIAALIVDARPTATDVVRGISGSVAQRFKSLAEKWKTETRFISDTNELCSHPVYQEIIGLGPEALPFLFDELASEPRHWFWALKAIAGFDPVPEEDRGRVKRMTKHWLDWGRENGLCGRD